MTDWNNYKNIFPTRYLELGYFDEYIKKFVLDKKPKKILDIGGGVDGTTALKDSGALVYLLDPFVTNKPDWIYEKIDWNNNEKFDVIVARGSINYLTEAELIKIKDFVNPGGYFIANTFLNPPDENWSERPYVNVSGQNGIERSRYITEKKTIEHELILPTRKTVNHLFFYYSPSDYLKIFPNINTTEYKKNSAILCFKKVT